MTEMNKISEKNSGQPVSSALFSPLLQIMPPFLRERHIKKTHLDSAYGRMWIMPGQASHGS